MRVALSLTVVLAACTPAPEAGPAADPAAVREELLAADRAFAESADRDGLEGWMSWYADDGVRLQMGGEVAQGRDAIRRFDEALFADTTMILRWDPTNAGAFGDGSHGFTTGRGALVSRYGGDTAWTGHYITIWRRGGDGRWQVILDTGS